ncbi:MAG: hypothetical protein L7U87_01820 [Chlamydiales bacterium]|nr:hypothetical protein [Chlamydiales bacterium]
MGGYDDDEATAEAIRRSRQDQGIATIASGTRPDIACGGGYMGAASIITPLRESFDPTGGSDIDDDDDEATAEARARSLRDQQILANARLRDEQDREYEAARREDERKEEEAAINELKLQQEQAPEKLRVEAELAEKLAEEPDVNYHTLSDLALDIETIEQSSDLIESFRQALDGDKPRVYKGNFPRILRDEVVIMFDRTTNKVDIFSSASGVGLKISSSLVHGEGVPTTLNRLIAAIQESKQL